ncbi:uncharacterized protein LOC106664038 [Cimex lectularius]|uniref:F-box domain-containing protein n=1 Tax=Cimex lectularius TaxID=79782 RepID=A0A8I6TCW3_CIMLE|nr:uncharacterized protein LOC106664038 [Cimex lectularius]
MEGLISWLSSRRDDEICGEMTKEDEVKDLFELPEELLEVILSRLSVKDLVSCSKVSKMWRIGVNLNSIWKNICRNEGYSDKLINTTPPHLFIDQPKEDSEEKKIDCDLEPLCYWRRVFGRFKELARNWQDKKFQRFRLSEGSSPVHCLDSDGVTAVTGHEDSTISVWSVLSVPHLKQKIKAVLSGYPITSVKTTTRYVIAVQKKLLLVYTKENENYKLTDIKSFELGEDNIEQMEKLKALGMEYSSWYKETMRINEDHTALTIRPLLYAIVDDHLYASCCGTGIVRMWTLPGSEFVSCKAGLSEIQQIETDGTSLFLVVHTEITHLLKYSKEDDAVKMLLSVPGLKRFVIGEKLVMAFPLPGDICLKRLWVWKKDDYSQPVGTKTIGSSHFSAILVQSVYIIYSEDSMIHVWNPVQNTILISFSVGSVVGFIREGFGFTLVVFMTSSLHLWDWKSGKRLYRFYTGLEWTGNYKNLVWVNCSMLLSAGVHNQLEMLSFW